MTRALSILLLATLAPRALAARDAEEILRHAREDPAKILGAESCGECHVAAFDLWKRTPHATGFKTLHRKESAENIARKMGYRLIKRQSICFTCHYTPALDDGELRVISGVSCESCHGASADWIDVHNDYGGKGRNHANEAAEHRAQRIERSRQAGMRRPSDLYDVAGRCFGCHTVPIEQLVNVGGHSTGSASFEFVEWSQGEIRHNFLDSFLAGSGNDNVERAVDRRRVMYVAGRALDLEFSLRGVAVAESQGVYAKAMSRRVRSALAEIRALAREGGIAELDRMIEVMREVNVVPGNETALLAAAGRIGEAARAFLATHDGTRLAAIDPLMLGTFGVDEELPPADVVAEASGEAAPQTTPGAPGGPGSSAGEPAAAVEGTPTTSPAGAGPQPAGPRVVGAKKRRIRPVPEHRTLGQESCSGCHGEQNAWWFNDKHFAAADPFLNREDENVRIARAYGIDPDSMTLGTSICMDCHATVVSGRERREALDGVACEECHGAAGDWLEPHKDETDKQLGRQRPGYQRALTLGKRNLASLEVRAEACTGCHYVTDDRLISSGHPSGLGFDWVSAMEKIRHWDEPQAPGGQIQTAFNAALRKRGPVPDVPVVQLAGGSPVAGGGGQPPGSSAAAPAASSTAEAVRPDLTSDQTPGSPRVAVTRPRPFAAASPGAAPGGEPIDLPQAGAVPEDGTIEERILLLKERLEQLYAAIGEDR